MIVSSFMIDGAGPEDEQFQCPVVGPGTEFHAYPALGSCLFLFSVHKLNVDLQEYKVTDDAKSFTESVVQRVGATEKFLKSFLH